MGSYATELENFSLRAGWGAISWTPLHIPTANVKLCFGVGPLFMFQAEHSLISFSLFLVLETKI